MMQKKDKLIIGRNEWCSLPELSLGHIRAKIDTGAATSALHAEDIRLMKRKGKAYVSFHTITFADESTQTKQCHLPMLEMREVISSNGHKEERYVVETMLEIGPVKQVIEVTLTDRNLMRYNLLLGRQALKYFAIVDPSKSYLLGTQQEAK